MHFEPLSQKRQDEIDLDILNTDPEKEINGHKPFVIIFPFGWKFYATHANFEIRQAVAQHPWCPVQIRDLLKADPDIRVRATAWRHAKHLFQPRPQLSAT